MLGTPINRHLLYVCSGQGARARIAEYYTYQSGIKSILADSASFEVGPVNTLASIVMRELAPNHQLEHATSIFDRFANGEHYPLIICLCDDGGNDQCPAFRSCVQKLYGTTATITAWNIPDFRTLDGSREQQLTQARHIRDLIAHKVAILLGQLKPYMPSHGTVDLKSVLGDHKEVIALAAQAALQTQPQASR